MSGASSGARRVFVVGGTGYIGKQVVRELLARGSEVVCLVRAGKAPAGAIDPALSGADVRFGDVTERASIVRDGLRGERFSAVVSCLATRTGHVKDSWAIEHQANLDVLEACKGVGESSGFRKPTRRGRGPWSGRWWGSFPSPARVARRLP